MAEETELTAGNRLGQEVEMLKAPSSDRFLSLRLKPDDRSVGSDRSERGHLVLSAR